MAAKKLNLVIRQGETFQRIIRWEMPPYIYRPITAITKAGPASITATSHGLATGWRVAVVSVQGMTEINAVNNPPRESEFKQVTYVDANTVTLNTVNSAEYSTYTSGGYLQFYTPVDLTSYTARMDIKNKVGGTELLTLTDGNARIILNNTDHTITLTITAADTEILTFKTGVYDLELVAPTGTVTTLFTGNVSVTREVTT